MQNRRAWIAAIFMVSVCLADIPYVEFPNWATSGNEIQTFPNAGSLNAAATKYIFVHSFVPENRVIVFERDTDGFYSLPWQMPWPRQPDFITTNGKWFGTLGGNFIDTFQLGAEGTFENITTFASEAKLMQFMYDNTLLLIKETSLQTYEFVAEKWTKIHEQNVNFRVMTYFVLEGSATESAPHVTDTTLAAFNPSNSTIELYTRNQDRSWSLVDQFWLNTTEYLANRIIWNGNDTVVLAHTTFYEVLGSTSFGRLIIFELKNGEWKMTRVIKNAEISTTLPGFLGFAMLLYQPNVILVSAPSKANYGEIEVLQRLPGKSWEFTTRFVGPYERNLYGYNIMRTDYDVIVQSGHFVESQVTYQSAISECYLPMQHTCSGDIFDTCQTNFNIPPDRLYTVQDNCTSLYVENLQFSQTSTTVSFSLSRDFSDTRTCNVTIQCTSPPVATTVPQTTPSSVPSVGNIPVSSPTSIPASNPAASVTSAGAITPRFVQLTLLTLTILVIAL